MSYSLVMIARRIQALESLPSARKPLIIRGGLPEGFKPNATPPGPKPTDPATLIAPQPGAE